MTTQELNEKVQALQAKGCKLSVDKIEAIVLKSEKATNKKLSNAASFSAKIAQRELVANTQAGDICEIMHNMARNQAKHI